MKIRAFESFARMIDGIPAQAILKAVELEHWMLEDDLLYKRIPETEDVASILSLCQFINAVVNGHAILPVALPIAHVAFYRKTVMWLIEIEALPFTAREQFDETFSSGFLGHWLANQTDSPSMWQRWRRN